MRTTEEMLELIIKVAKEDPDIRAVLMSGSRANKDCPVDQYQDFDIVYFVKDVQPYWDNMAWREEKFGKPILVQKPDSIELIPPDNDGNISKTEQVMNIRKARMNRGFGRNKEYDNSKHTN